MKNLLLMIILVAFLSACSDPAAYRGSVRDLIPQQVGNFKLQGDPKPVGIAPPAKYVSGALRPTEAMVAQYEAPDRSKLSFEVVNYPSAADATRALNQMEENTKKLVSGAQLTESTRTGSKQQAAIRKLVIEGIAPGFDAVLWVNGSVSYQVSGDNLKAVLEFEQSLP